MAYGKGNAFYLVLPGATAILEEHPNGGFILQSLHVDGEYEAMQQQAQQPGLWRVSKILKSRPELQSDGKIMNINTRAVGISDMTDADLAEVVIPEVRESLMAVETTKDTTNNFGFDLHITPGGSGIRGLKKASSALSTDKDIKIVKSAHLLANTMYQARNQLGVIWFSDYGGSAILTRALQILHREKGITLTGHSLFMNHPTSKGSVFPSFSNTIDASTMRQ